MDGASGERGDGPAAGRREGPSAPTATVDPSDVVPQLRHASCDAGGAIGGVGTCVTFGELRTCVKVLDAIAALAPNKKKRKNVDKKNKSGGNGGKRKAGDSDDGSGNDSGPFFQPPRAQVL